MIDNEMEDTDPRKSLLKSAYLGKKGYTIFKSEISAQELKEIRDELLMRPYVPKSPQQMPAFKIYSCLLYTSDAADE